jgi:hypothetical protein
LMIMSYLLVKYNNSEFYMRNNEICYNLFPTNGMSANIRVSDLSYVSITLV